MTINQALMTAHQIWGRDIRLCTESGLCCIYVRGDLMGTGVGWTTALRRATLKTGSFASASQMAKAINV